MTTSLRPAVAIAGLLVTGCGAKWIDYAASTSPRMAVRPRSPNSVRVFFAGPPSCPYEELGGMENKQSWLSWWRSLEEIVDAMRLTAAAHGADAVIFGNHADNHNAGGHSFLGVAIRFRGNCAATASLER